MGEALFAGRSWQHTQEIGVKWKHSVIRQIIWGETRDLASDPACLVPGGDVDARESRRCRHHASPRDGQLGPVVLF